MVNFMVAVDETQQSESAFYIAAKMLNTRTDKLYVIHVLVPNTQSWSWYSPFLDVDQDTANAKQKITDTGKLLLDKFQNLCAAMKIQYEPVLAVGVDVGATLCEEVKKRNIDFLVVYRRGMGAIQRMLQGSVSKHLVEYAPCTVIVAKDEWMLENEKMPVRGKIVKSLSQTELEARTAPKSQELPRLNSSQEREEGGFVEIPIADSPLPQKKNVGKSRLTQSSPLGNSK
eukprot:TRINITY_DN12600_c0_g1_i1.p1 TRINITY_DN12600_c0_g1~~TRINITY_DN12600_c0_g1_i1.p1  ORF type:complete len:229 (-),score=45.12 TRINITY_DN12600_c0_g1_i1:80-766(-)